MESQEVAYKVASLGVAFVDSLLAKDPLDLQARIPLGHVEDDEVAYEVASSGAAFFGLMVAEPE